MKQRESWEDKIKDALALECDDFTACQDLKDRIDEKILTSREVDNMKHLSVKKLVVGVAVGCLLVSGGVLAAEHVAFMTIHSNALDAVRSYDKMDKMEQKLGYEVDSVERFSNGYQFEKMSVDKVQAENEEGNSLYTYNMMDIVYQKSGEPSVRLCIEKPFEGTLTYRKQDADVRNCGNIVLYYNSSTNKFVPPDYELTAEDKANMELDSYNIAFGSSEVEIQQFYSVVWEKDGVVYKLCGFDLNLSADDMFDMAEEVIGTK